MWLQKESKNGEQFCQLDCLLLQIDDLCHELWDIAM